MIECIMAIASFKIHGMDCTEEVTVLKREVGPLGRHWFSAS